MYTTIRTKLLVLALLASACGLGSARAQGAMADQWELEIYGGWFSTDTDLLDEKGTYGIRLANNLTDRIQWQLSGGFLDFGEDFDSTVFEGDIDADVWFLDLSLGVNLRPDSRWNPMIFGGIGYADTDVEGTLVVKATDLEVSFDDFGGSSFTAHVGLNSKFYATERFFINPSLRLRWYESRESDDTDLEYTLGLGWVW